MNDEWRKTIFYFKDGDENGKDIFLRTKYRPPSLLVSCWNVVSFQNFSSISCTIFIPYFHAFSDP
jgi:hypothetical protein